MKVPWTVRNNLSEALHFLSPSCLSHKEEYRNDWGFKVRPIPFLFLCAWSERSAPRAEPVGPRASWMSVTLTSSFTSSSLRSLAPWPMSEANVGGPLGTSPRGGGEATSWAKKRGEWTWSEWCGYTPPILHSASLTFGSWRTKCTFGVYREWAIWRRGNGRGIE